MGKPPPYRKLPDEDLRPQAPVADVPVDRQAKTMRELRDLANSVPASYAARDDRMLSLALSNSLSRADMARAIGVVKSRVDQIIRTRAEYLESLNAREGADRVARHSPGRNLSGGR